VRTSESAGLCRSVHVAVCRILDALQIRGRWSNEGASGNLGRNFCSFLKLIPEALEKGRTDPSATSIA
jgi:hypothetical protein